MPDVTITMPNGVQFTTHGSRRYIVAIWHEALDTWAVNSRFDERSRALARWRSLNRQGNTVKLIDRYDKELVR